MPVRSPIGFTASGSTASGPVESTSGASGAVSTGAVGESSNAGTATVGRDALVAEISGSLVGPAWAGATELALMAAQISKADRIEGNMKSAKHAVNRPIVSAHYSANTTAVRSYGDSPSRVASRRFFRSEDTPRSTCLQAFCRMNGRVNPQRSFQR